MTYRRCICHPDDLPGVGISSGWVTANSLCHPDDILFHFMSSGWLNWGWFLIRMSYGNVIMSSGWDTLPFLSHPDEIANFDFPQHAVALQRFRTFPTDLHSKGPAANTTKDEEPSRPLRSGRDAMLRGRAVMTLRWLARGQGLRSDLVTQPDKVVTRRPSRFDGGVRWHVPSTLWSTKWRLKKCWI